MQQQCDSSVFTRSMPYWSALGTAGISDKNELCTNRLDMPTCQHARRFITV